MLATKDELLCQLDSTTISSEALQVVGGWARHTLQDLNGVA